MTFGDILINDFISEKSPLQALVFLKYEGKFIICVNKSGVHSFYKSSQDKYNFLRVVGKIDFSKLDEFC